MAHWKEDKACVRRQKQRLNLLCMKSRGMVAWAEHIREHGMTTVQRHEIKALNKEIYDLVTNIRTEV